MRDNPKYQMHIHLRMDNVSALTYVNRMGGTRSPELMRVPCSLWDWCLQRGITLSASHLPGVNNPIADQESREVRTSAEWRLHKGLFLRVCNILGPCDVDLFTSRLNYQLPQYISWKPDPGVMSTDAFQSNWTNLKGYTFPPFVLIGRCLQKIRVEQSTVVLIAPTWQNQIWYPVLLEMLIEVPILLPWCKDMLTNPENQPHPLVTQNRLRLAAWKISGDSTLQQEFRTKLQNSSLQDGAEEQTWHTSQVGSGGVAGVREGRLIPFQLGFSPS